MQVAQDTTQEAMAPKYIHAVASAFPPRVGIISDFAQLLNSTSAGTFTHPSPPQRTRAEGRHTPGPRSLKHTHCVLSQIA